MLFRQLYKVLLHHYFQLRIMYQNGNVGGVPVVFGPQNSTRMAYRYMIMKSAFIPKYVCRAVGHSSFSGVLSPATTIQSTINIGTFFGMATFPFNLTTNTRFFHYFSEIVLTNDQNITHFNVQISSKYTMSINYFVVVVMVFNIDNWAISGFKVDSTNIVGSNIDNNWMSVTYTGFYDFSGAMMLYGLLSYDYSGAMDCGFVTDMVYAGSKKWTFKLKNTQTSPSSVIKSLTMSIIMVGMISCPGTELFINNEFTQCYQSACKSGTYPTPDQLRTTGITICQNCTQPCKQCASSPKQCTACYTGMYLDPGPKTCFNCSNLPFENCIHCDINSCITCVENYVLSPNNNCYFCLVQIKKCTQCFHDGSATFCTLCEDGFIVAFDSFSCIDCQTIVSHCSSCTLTTCSSYMYPFSLGQTGLCDDCVNGFYYVGGQCKSVSDCQVFAKNSTTNKQKCISCNSAFHFVYLESNSSCVCSTGYALVKKGLFMKCQSVCGDGITIFGSEECDDSNLANNDGCNEFCKEEKDFTCTTDSPSQCTLKVEFTAFEFNYAIKIQMKNRCKFSFSLYPSHPAFKIIQWKNYLKLNLSNDYIDKNSIEYTYSFLTSEIFLEFDYIQTLENIQLEAYLSFQNPTRRLTQINLGQSDIFPSKKSQSSIDDELASVSASSTPIPSKPPLLTGSISSQLTKTLKIKLSGLNAPLNYEESVIQQAYFVASIISIIVTVLVLLQFFIGSYFGKMIGIETLHVLQFFYFIRILIDQHNTSLLNSMNVLKYSAYAGYANYPLLFGQQNEQQAISLTYMTVNKNFVYVGLMKFFTCNVNFSLIPPVIALLAYSVSLIRKYHKRNIYMQTRDQWTKDEYTLLRRSSQWVYDHFVFPFIIVFNMIIVFCAILYLQSSSQTSSATLNESDNNQILELSSFSPHLVILFFTLAVYCFQLFLSYDSFIRSRMTERQRLSIPESLIQKLEHDENNPDRPNYKPGYVLVYLLAFFAIEIVIMLTVMVKPFKKYGLDVLIGLEFIYLIFVWIWRPYSRSVDFHNKVLRLNHLTILVIMIVCEIFNKINLTKMVYISLVYLALLFLVFVTVCGYIRIYVEYKFRKRLVDDPNLLQWEVPQKACDEDNDSNIKNAGMLNPYLFQNQLKQICKKNDIPFQNYQDSDEDYLKLLLLKEIYSNQKLNKEIRKANYFANVQNGTNLIETIIGINQNLHQRKKSKKYQQVETQLQEQQRQSITKRLYKPVKPLRHNNL